MTGRNSLQIVSNKVRGVSLGNNNAESYNAVSFSNDQFSQATIATITGAVGVEMHVMVRIGGANTAYIFGAARNGPYRSFIRKVVAGTETDLKTENATTWAAGDVLRGEARGRCLVLYRNGVPLLTAIDADITSGRPGMGIWYASGASLANAELDGWSAADLDTTLNTLASDNFDRADANPIGGDWSTLVGDFAGGQIVGNRLQSTGNDSDIRYNLITANNDQWSQAKIITNSNGPGTSTQVEVRVSTSDTYPSSTTFYFFSLQDSLGTARAFKIEKAVSDVFTTLSTGTSDIASGDTIRLEVRGSILIGLVNGVAVVSAIDSSITSGRSGLGFYLNGTGNTVNQEMDDFAMGDFTSSTPTPTPTTSVPFGGSLNVTPTTATDNGSITAYVVQSVEPALTTAPTVNGDGVVSITNAQPSGTHLITIRASDNCGLTTDAQFTLDVGAAPQFSIDDVTQMEGNAGTTSYTFTVTRTGNTALNATVDCATVDGTATSPSDFTSIPTTTLTFLPADTTKQITVLVNGDTTFEPDETFTVHLSNANGATISDADGTGTIINDDSLLISGRVLYADTVTPGRNVTLTLTGPSFTTRTTTTDSNGDYTFAGVPPGNDYTVTPSKTGDVNGLESLDASDAARYVAGLNVPSANQRIAADADDDGNLTSFDASLIARYVAGLPNSGIVGNWKFVPASSSYQALSGDQTGQNFTAILVGDTGGNWIPSFASGGSFGNSNPDPLAARSSSHPAVTVPVLLPDTAVPVGSNVSIPITVSDLTGLGVRAYDVQITFNPLIVQPQATPYDNAGTLSSGMSITPNATNAGHLIISAFQAADLSGSGTLLWITFTVVGSPGQVTPLAFEAYSDPNSVFHPGFRFNAGDPQASTTNGSLTIDGPTAAPATISGRITKPDGSPEGGAVMHLSGAVTRTTVSDSAGNYHFDDLDTDHFYTVTPSLANYHFAPASRSFSPVGNITDAAFTANPDATQTSNAIDMTEYFVRQQYLDFLGREPDQGGLEYWSAQINHCNGDANCISQRRIDVSAAFFASAEFQQTGSYIYGVYAGTLGRTLNYGEFSADRAQVLGGAGLDPAKTAFAESFVQRPEFISRYPQGITREQFVDGVIQTMTQRSGVNQASLRDGFLSDYDVGGRALVVRHAAEASSFVAAEYNKAFVLMEYFGYLRREIDQGGYVYWLDVLSQNGGNYRGMVCAFLTSTEYQQRFSSVVTHYNGECASVTIAPRRSPGNNRQIHDPSDARQPLICRFGENSITDSLWLHGSSCSG
jgi:hypothetical protein